MYIQHLSLTAFRNYSRLEQNFEPGVTILHGSNAQGKTNLLEAIYYLATTRSPYADTDQQIINWEVNNPEEPIVVSRLVATIASSGAVAESSVESEADPSKPENTKSIELRLIREIKNGAASFRREAVIDRRKVRLMDLLGQLRVVMFLPTDLELITGAPANRRRYLDITLCQADSIYLRTLSNFNKILEQRNAALKNLAETGRGKEVVSLLSDRLAEAAATIYARRSQFMGRLAEATSTIHYEKLTGGKETIRLSYLPRLTGEKIGRGSNEKLDELEKSADWLMAHSDSPSTIAQKYQEILQLTLDTDIASGTTRVGPHRDDWRFWVNGRNLAHFGSRGQQRTAMLALKIAEFQRMHEETGDPPILLLDEVSSELDEYRRNLLLNEITISGQALLTTTDLSIFTTEFLQKSTSILVNQGTLRTED